MPGNASQRGTHGPKSQRGASPTAPSSLRGHFQVGVLHSEPDTPGFLVCCLHKRAKIDGKRRGRGPRGLSLLSLIRPLPRAPCPLEAFASICLHDKGLFRREHPRTNCGQTPGRRTLLSMLSHAEITRRAFLYRFLSPSGRPIVCALFGRSLSSCLITNEIRVTWIKSKATGVRGFASRKKPCVETCQGC